MTTTLIKTDEYTFLEGLLARMNDVKTREDFEEVEADVYMRLEHLHSEMYRNMQ